MGGFKYCFVFCCRMLKETPNLNMNGHQRTTGKECTLTSFLIHHLNQRMNRNRLVITHLSLFINISKTFSVCVNSSIFLSVRDIQIRSGAFICKSPLRRISELVILSQFLIQENPRVRAQWLNNLLSEICLFNTQQYKNQVGQTRSGKFLSVGYS